MHRVENVSKTGKSQKSVILSGEKMAVSTLKGIVGVALRALNAEQVTKL